MRRPGGYGHVLGCDGPSAQLKDAYGREIPPECDSFTCGHCNTVVFVRPKEKPEDTGGMCYQCWGLVCPKCVEKATCRPFEKALEAIEARADALRSYGLG
jgi:hypothetical protein